MTMMGSVGSTLKFAQANIFRDAKSEWRKRALLLSSILLVYCTCGDAFTLYTPLKTVHRPRTLEAKVNLHTRASDLGTSLFAKRKRRRKQDPSEKETNENDDLPDFDLKEDETTSATSSRKNSSPTTSPSFRAPADMDTITPAMMKSSQQKEARSISELIADRSLESKFEFENGSESDEALPDLIEMMRNQNKNAVTPDSASNDESAVGRKKARQAERRAAAIAREEQESLQNKDLLTDLLGGISFLVDEEKGKVTYLKIVEAGTWLAIALLISWEVYINSPLFDRAAPLAPVVY